MDDKLKKLIEQNGGYITRKQIIGNRYLYYRLLESVKSGEIVRLKSGVYCMEEVMAHTMIDLDKIIPEGVLCLYSAWAHYGLTTQIPQGFYVAIPRKRKVTLPDYPPIILNYWDCSIYATGIRRERIDGIEVSIYDMEKSVCDALRYRNKIGIDVSAEILRNYLSRKERNITRLTSYAKSMRIAGVLNNYLEIQL
ncbi:type IV toxin-antitoxin system AbiEi family antitoxin domain-containing protein [Bacteroides nordii]|uniref:type IV toxin-antitoxin system AbiEi family antitoxin domain-containing protein n=1 Tax=Bacteroides nordii TaxID=291645 RepID=UPI001E5FB12B|nr:hypothetical protein [Bacteroides nordii]